LFGKDARIVDIKETLELIAEMGEKLRRKFSDTGKI
jgi:hypothetical protein